jgi:hypothetical protein
MKRFILFIALLFVGLVYANAQTVEMPPMGDRTYQYVATDYNLTNTTARNFVFTAPQSYKATQDYVIKLDSVSGNHTNVAVALFGGKSALKGDYTAIGSAINWKGQNKDTVIIISNTTANRYRFYKVVVTGTGVGVTRVADQELKIYLE